MSGTGEGSIGGGGEATDGSGAVKGGEEGKPVEVRFLDVPGSEETRAEKMTIVFTCTVSVRHDLQTTVAALCLYKQGRPQFHTVQRSMQQHVPCVRYVTDIKR